MARDQNSTWAKQFGVTIHLPYLDQDLMSLSLRIPPATLFVDGYAKAPLRRLVAERIPNVAMPKRKIVAAQMARETLVPLWQKTWLSMDRPYILTELGIMESQSLNDVMEGLFAGRNDELMLGAMIFYTEIWLRAHSAASGGIKNV
jgi:hypothetical protein